MMNSITLREQFMQQRELVLRLWVEDAEPSADDTTELVLDDLYLLGRGLHATTGRLM